jgi:hypothetical protein
MISVVILAADDERALALTLAALASAAVDGLVREVIVAGGNAQVAEVAEEAGARRAEGAEAAVASAKQPWLLVLTAGVRPQVGWEGAARGHMAHFKDRAGYFRLSLAAPGIGARVAELTAAWLGGARLEQGLLIARGRYALRPRRLRRLEARVLVDRLG